MTPEERAELLKLAEQDVRPSDETDRSPEGRMKVFLRDNEIKSGRTIGVETSSLYRFYKEWRELLRPQPELLSPSVFARELNKVGLRRKGRATIDGRDARPLLLGPSCAARLVKWATENPGRPEDRTPFAFGIFRRPRMDP